MLIDATKMGHAESYYTMIQTVIPRPIAWILSDNGNETYNLAPFSFFNGVTAKPPIIAISIGKKSDGSLKDSWKNVDERDYFVMHIPSVHHAEALTHTGASLEHGKSEITEFGIDTKEIEGWPLPIVKDAKVAYLCKKERIVEVGSTPQGFLFGTVEAIYIDDEICEMVDGRLKVDAKKMNPLSRLGGDDFGTLGEILTVKKTKK